MGKESLVIKRFKYSWLFLSCLQVILYVALYYISTKVATYVYVVYCNTATDALESNTTSYI